MAPLIVSQTRIVTLVLDHVRMWGLIILMADIEREGILYADTVSLGNLFHALLSYWVLLCGFNKAIFLYNHTAAINILSLIWIKLTRENLHKVLETVTERFSTFISWYSQPNPLWYNLKQQYIYLKTQLNIILRTSYW